MQIEFLMKEIIILYRHYFISQTLISPCQGYCMPDLKKTGNINIPTKI